MQSGKRSVSRTVTICKDGTDMRSEMRIIAEKEKGDQLTVGYILVLQPQGENGKGSGVGNTKKGGWQERGRLADASTW